MKSLLSLLFLVLALPNVSATNINWGYGGNNISRAFGKAATGKVAIYVPAETAQLYKGSAITAVRVGLEEKASKVVAFVTKNLDDDYDTQKTVVGNLYSGYNEISLNDSYTIGDEGFYVGYEYEAEVAAAGLSCMYSPNGCWADFGNGWKDYASEENGHSNALSIQAKITGDALPNDFWIYCADEIMVGVGQSFQLKFSVMNLSTVIGRTIETGITIDDGAEEVQTFTSVDVGKNKVIDFSLDHDGYAEASVHTVRFRLITVNGEADDYAPNNEAVLHVYVTADPLPLQRMVVEEGTGTWCGWCPRGIVGLREMTDKYPDTFIGIAVHKGDEFVTSSYDQLKFSSLPGSYVMRDLSSSVNPAFSSLESFYNSLMKVQPEPVAGVRVDAGFSDDSKNQIYAVASAKFLESHDNLNYRFSFVLLEDGVYASQTNYYEGGRHGGMGGFENMDYHADVEMTHIARMNYSYNGYANSIPEHVVSDEVVTFGQLLDIPSNVSNKDSLTLVCLMIDQTTGMIVNAAEEKVGNSAPTGIVDVGLRRMQEFSLVNGSLDTNNWQGIVTIYDASGKQVANHNLRPGFYILRCNDETGLFVRKMMLK